MRKSYLGKRFEKLLVIKEYYETTETGKNIHYCECLCDCGSKKIILASHLVTGHTKSCGCLHKEKLSKMKSTHKQTGTRLYNIYVGMKYRCYTKTCRRYKDYGGRGISICKEWLQDFNNFKKWAEKNGYTNTLTIDRIDNNGNYEPSNCRWIPAKEQAKNKRNNVFYYVNGEKLNVMEIQRRYGIERHELRKRILAGEKIENIFQKSVDKIK